MARASVFFKSVRWITVFLLLAFVVLSSDLTSAQSIPKPCDEETDSGLPDAQCPPGVPLPPDDPVMSEAVPLMDGNTNLYGRLYQ
jgi:hypothetical protein